MARILYDRLNEIKTKHLSPQSVTGDKIASDAIEEKHIKDGVVTRRKIADGVVGTDELVDGSVTTVKIASKAVTNDKLQSASVTNEKIADGSITSGKIVAGAITTEKIANGAITRDKVADQSVRTEYLVDGAITNVKIAANTITASKIAANAVGSSEIAPNAVGYSEIASQSLEPRSIKTISGAPATEGQIPVADLSQGNQWWFKWVTPGAEARPLTPPVTTDEIGDGQVTGPKIASSAVGSSQLAVDSVITEKIQDGAVTPEKLSFVPGGGGDTLTMLPVPATALDQGGIIATTQPASVDLSSIIPVGTKGVIVSIACINQGYTDGGMMAYIFRQLGAEYALQVMAPPVNAPGISNGASVLMPVAADRTLLWQAYVNGNSSTELVIYILGYIM